MASQLRHKVGHFVQFTRIMLQMTLFYKVFCPVSKERGLGQIQNCMDV